MKIKCFVSGALLSNGYIIYQKEGAACYIIDPGYSPQKWIHFVQEKNLQPKGILLTHLHHDHTGAAEAVADVLHCPICMHEDDAFVYRGKVDIMLKDEMQLDLDGECLQVIATPGHTKGSICIMSEKSRVCFTGDTIFDTDLGRTDLAGGSEADLRRSVREIIDRWENDIVIYPGHDSGCTMKKVRLYNHEFLALRDGNER